MRRRSTSRPSGIDRPAEADLRFAAPAALGRRGRRKGTPMTPLLTSDFPGLKLLGRGKVRDNYELDGSLLIVSTDRISAFDHILPNGVPDKGKVLNQISIF